MSFSYHRTTAHQNRLGSGLDPWDTVRARHSPQGASSQRGQTDANQDHHNLTSREKNETSGEKVAEEFLETMEHRLDSRARRHAVSLGIDNRRISFADVRSRVSL